MTLNFLALALVLTGSTASAQPVRMSVAAFGGRAHAEVRDLEPQRAEQAVRRALEEVRSIEALTNTGDPQSAVARLNAGAGKGAREVDPRLLALLERAESFCFWSDGIQGSLGGRLNLLWGLHRPIQALPTAEALQAGAQSAACANLTLNRPAKTVSLAAGSAIDLWAFAPGFAVDSAVAVLKQLGVRSGWVKVGAVERGFGEGPGGEGWPFRLPAVPGMAEPDRGRLLHDQAFAFVAADDLRLGLAGERWAPYFDQRDGRTTGASLLATATVTDLAVDAQALAVTMFIGGSRQGSFRLGSLRPTPSVLWLFGSGDNEPVFSGYHWFDAGRK